MLRKLAPEKGGQQCQAAYRGFVILGDRAAKVAPDLAAIVRESSNDTVATLVAHALSNLGPETIRPPVKLASDARLSPRRRVSALATMRNMSYLGTNAAPCINALVRCGTDTNFMVANTARISLDVLTHPERQPAAVIDSADFEPAAVIRQPTVRPAVELGTASDKFIGDLIRQSTNDAGSTAPTEALRLPERQRKENE